MRVTSKSNRYLLIIKILIGLFFLFLVIFPFYWIVVTSIKAPSEVTSIPPTILPRSFQIDYYKKIFTSYNMDNYLKNSLVVAVLSTTICSIIGALAAYPLARIPIRFKKVILLSILSISMFPSIAVIAPLFLSLRDLGLINTRFGLVFPYTSFQLPITVWVLTNFFKEIPLSLEDAASIDGCSPMQTFLHIMIPLAIPGVSTMIIMNFINAWNEFLMAYTFTRSSTAQTVPVGISLIQGEYEFPWGYMSAASVIATVPLIIMVLVLQRKVIDGLTAGAVKG